MGGPSAPGDAAQAMAHEFPCVSASAQAWRERAHGACGCTSPTALVVHLGACHERGGPPYASDLLGVVRPCPTRAITFEPPDADPHVRWCGRGRAQRAPLCRFRQPDHPRDPFAAKSPRRRALKRGFRGRGDRAGRRMDIGLQADRGCGSGRRYDRSGTLGVAEFPATIRRIAPVAQLDRVPGYEPGGRGFESCRARQKSRT